MSKQPDRIIKSFVGEWLKKADSDIRLAEYLLAENTPFWDAISFHCQLEIPKTHNIRELLVFVAGIDKKLAQFLKPATTLTPYGVLVRYPDDAQRVDRKKAEMAIGLAQKVEKSIKKKLKL